MFRCTWCNKKIGDDESLYALNVRFADGVDFTENEGEIVQVYLNARGTSVPMIVTTNDSEAKKAGQDGLFVACSKTCGEKMKVALKSETETFKGVSDMED